MIRIYRPPAPLFYSTEQYRKMQQDLQDRAQRTTQERLKYEVSYLKIIRTYLMEVFNKKCAYCESQLGVASEMQIDNFRPKNANIGPQNGKAGYYYWLAYDWENLYGSCQNCNIRKRNAFPLEDELSRCEIGERGEALLREQRLLVDPCFDEPREHFNFQLDGTVRGLSKMGQTTIDIIGLNRNMLIEARQRAISDLASQIVLAGAYSDSIIEEIKSGHSGKPYLAALQNFILLMQTGNVTPEQFLQLRTTPPPEVPIAEYIEFSRFSLRRIELNNFRTISNLAIEVLGQANDSSSFPWLALLGDNGVGKSTILQAVSLALAGEKYLDKVKQDPVELLRSGETNGFVRVFCFEKDEPVELTFTASRISSNLAEPASYLLGYGAFRLLPKPNSTKPQRHPDPVNIESLFDHKKELIDPEKWLNQLTDEQQQRVFTALFDILDLRGEDHVSFDGQIWVTRSGHTTPLRFLSDGYRSMIALACDIMATLSHDDSFYYQKEGIVLIDEMGNHLHPRWRMKVVGALREAFPSLQFIVSTHEPLCLRGLNYGEVVVLLRDRQHQVQKLDKTLLPDHTLMRVDQLLTSDLFGLLNTLDDETEKSYEDYYNLLQQPPEERSPEVNAKVLQLSAQLAQEEILGATPQLQALYAVINETFAKHLREDGFKTKSQLKSETINEVKDMIDKNQIDWL